MSKTADRNIGTAARNTRSTGSNEPVSINEIFEEIAEKFSSLAKRDFVGSCEKRVKKIETIIDGVRKALDVGDVDIDEPISRQATKKTSPGVSADKKYFVVESSKGRELFEIVDGGVKYVGSLSEEDAKIFMSLL